MEGRYFELNDEPYFFACHPFSAFPTRNRGVTLKLIMESDDWHPDELVFAIERHIYEEERRASEELGLSITDSNVKSALRKAMGLGKGRAPKSPAKEPKDHWVASLATGIDRILKDCIREGVPHRETGNALATVERSLKTRREMAGGSRAYLDFLKRFLEKGEMI